MSLQYTALASAYIRRSTSGQELTPAVQVLEISKFARESGLEIDGLDKLVELAGSRKVAESDASKDGTETFMEAIAAIADEEIPPRTRRSSAVFGFRVGRVFFDSQPKGSSKAVEDRPVLMALLGSLTRGESLVVDQRDRLARSHTTSAVIEYNVQRAGGRLLSATGIGNGNEPHEILIKAMMAAFAEFEKSQIRLRTRAALDAKRRRNERLGGDVPYGFRLARDNRHLVEDPNEQRIIGTIVGLRRRGESLRKIAGALALQKFTARNGKPFHATTINRILARHGDQTEGESK